MAARTSSHAAAPLFPWLIAEFGFSYSELGVLVSGVLRDLRVGQALSGFW